MYTNSYRTNYNIRGAYNDTSRKSYPIVSVLSDDAWDSWRSHTAGAHVILDTSVLMPYRKENLRMLYERVLSTLTSVYNTTFYVTEDTKADLNTLANSSDSSKLESIELARECQRWLMTYISRGVVKVADNSAMRDVDASIRQLANQLMSRNCQVVVLTRDRSMATDLLKAGIWTWYMDTKLKVVQFTNLTVPGVPQRQEQRSAEEVVPFKPRVRPKKEKSFFQRFLALFGIRAA